MRCANAGRSFPAWRKLGAVLVGVLTLTVAVVAVLNAHDLFLKPERFFVRANDSVRVDVLNGTFTTSEAAVTPDRLVDLAVAGPSGVTHPAKASWTAGDKRGRWRVAMGSAGTYVLGAAVLPRVLKLQAKDFNAYLVEDGLPDVLADRRAKGELDRPARERYSKHVKTLIQVGDQRSERVDVAFSHAAELIPLANPYRLHAGDMLSVRAVVDGAPVSNQVVLAGGHDESGRAFDERSVRTDREGIARVSLRTSGVWYVKFIRMRRVEPAGGDSVDYESKWATLTFAVR